MKPRMNFYQAAPDTMKAMMALENQIASSGLEQSLMELVKTRASQINGCAFCIDMHIKDARAAGETEQRLYSLDAWRETPFTPSANEQLWNGPRPLHSSRRITLRTMSSCGSASISAKRNWS